MNTYTVTYFPPGASAPPSAITVQAVEFFTDPEFVLFIDTDRATVLAVPLALTPIITRAAS